MFTAKDHDHVAANIAIGGDMTVFSVNFRNAPETKAPWNIKDCYAATKYIS